MDFAKVKSPHTTPYGRAYTIRGAGCFPAGMKKPLAGLGRSDGEGEHGSDGGADGADDDDAYDLVCPSCNIISWGLAAPLVWLRHWMPRCRQCAGPAFPEPFRWCRPRRIYRPVCDRASSIPALRLR